MHALSEILVSRVSENNSLCSVVSAQLSLCHEVWIREMEARASVKSLIVPPVAEGVLGTCEL